MGTCITHQDEWFLKPVLLSTGTYAHSAVSFSPALILPLRPLPLFILPSPLTHTRTQVSDLQKKAGELKSAMDETCVLAEKVVNDRITKQQYIDQEKTTQTRISRLQSDIDAMVQTL